MFELPPWHKIPESIAECFAPNGEHQLKAVKTEESVKRRKEENLWECEREWQREGGHIDLKSECVCRLAYYQDFELHFFNQCQEPVDLLQD